MLKRCFDILASIIGLIVLAPIIAILSVVVLCTMGRPVIFRQQRPGQNGKPFFMYKFRSMKNAFDENGVALSDAERLTGLGKFLRSSSLDELPELLNVLRGEMSVVGPRPLLMQYLPLYSKEQARRHDLKPGITGWAQVNGRNNLSWDEKFALDVWYVDNQSFRLDMKILWRTFGAVIFRKGISNAEHATMPPFAGDK